MPANEPQPFDTCVELLHEIAQRWRKSKEDLDTEVALRLAPYLSVDFEHANTAAPLAGVANPVLLESQENALMIGFREPDDWPYRALFRKENNNWKLLSLVFQCPVCFGTGENDGVCIVCGGTGWGVKGDLHTISAD